jgi:predicted RecA/RadA family phage recombinase
VATNKVNDGDVVEIIAPYTVVSGRVVLLGAVGAFGIAVSNAASGANVAISTMGTFAIPKSTAVSTSIASGGYVYWDNTNNQATVSATSNTKIGVALKAAANTDATVLTRINPSF